MQMVDELDGLLKDLDEVWVVEKVVTVPKDLADKFPGVDTVLHIIDKVIDIRQQHLLVLSVVPYELYQKDVRLLKYS